MKRSGLTTALYVALVFLSGAVAGSVATRLYTTSSVQARPSQRPSPEEFRRRYVEEMKTRLKLNDDQLGRLQSILDETRARFHDARQRQDAEMKTIHGGQVEKIRSILSEEQRTEYEKMRAERQKRREMEQKKFGRPPSKPAS